ncbi:MAG TPA: DUF2267 domain-containing protein [Bacillota bacterium]
MEPTRVVQAPELYARVRDAAGLHSDEEAARTVRQVLRSLARAVPNHLCGRLAQGLPPELAVELEDACGGDPLLERHGFIGPLVNRMDTEYGYDESLGGLDLSSVYADDDASRWVRAVFGALKEAVEPSTAHEIERHLPEEIADWWRQAGGAARPGAPSPA